ncbi:MAG: ribosome-associated translation inhibitor RaiA [Dehalococcoidales bacterium]|nr:ribosome-associated translation inhibitor RaiA [Dehalococcoidales bacterium]
MELQITGKNMNIPPEVHNHIERKLGKLSRYLSPTISSKVEIAEEKTRSPQQRFVVQVTVDSGGILLRGEERGADLFTAVDKVAAVMYRQTERSKGKLHNRRKNNSSIRGELGKVASIQPTGKVVKVKQFALEPMSVDEAIYQMELLGHNFFLFLNNDTEKVNLLYCRKDTNYGLIEAELE